MTGPEHYIEAEQLIALARTSPNYDAPAITLALAEAQVHATLALAAATADQPAQAPADALMRRAWRAVTGPFIKAAPGGGR